MRDRMREIKENKVNFYTFSFLNNRARAPAPSMYENARKTRTVRGGFCLVNLHKTASNTLFVTSAKHLLPMEPTKRNLMGTPRQFDNMLQKIHIFAPKSHLWPQKHTAAKTAVNRPQQFLSIQKRIRAKELSAFILTFSFAVVYNKKAPKRGKKSQETTKGCGKR